METTVNCDMCAFKYDIGAAVLFLSHLKRHHRFEKGSFYTTCKLSGCLKIFLNFSTYQAHWYRAHNPKSHKVALKRVQTLRTDETPESEGKVYIFGYYVDIALTHIVYS